MPADTPQAIVNELIELDADVFNRFFVDLEEEQNIIPEVNDKANELFLSLYPNLNFKEFYHTFRLEKMTQNLNAGSRFEESEICPARVYDPQRRNYLRPSVLPPTKRRKKEGFDVYKFLMHKDENQEGHRLTLDCDVDLFEFDYEDKVKMNLMADQALRKIARIVVVLKDTCNYRMMELHGERRVC